jgi:large subunit ribosomal protein L25
MEMQVTATKRELQGKGASRRLRHAGKVPGVVYGAGKDAVAIEIGHNGIYHQLKHESFHASILTLDLDGAKESVLLRDFQMHPFKQLVMHVDFQRVAKDQKIHVKVPLHFINADIAPGVKQSGGNVSHIMNELDVACLPADLPEFIEVDLSNLASGHSIHLSELKLPKGVEVAHMHKGDLAVVTIMIPRGVATAEGEEGKEATKEAPKA